MCVCVCVYTHTHTHCTDGVFECEPRGLNKIPGRPKESRWTKSRHICIRICVQGTHVYVYTRRRDEILDCQTDCFFLEHVFPSEKENQKM